ncbi:venom prothrombin activator pseutarin-C non-catalytic subunit [Syngnathus scovelli]|uniref:venom prothrombin activator pseutarin-C non-catalytic subunit n=1 Tax=Syngnathus scovelli TaxID=161590 RepID=UPI00210F6841|nr:coagulation factor VIII isoform X1 [Syngnathus scovelli]
MGVSLLPLLLLCAVCRARNITVREHFIAAVEIGWDYVSAGDGDTTSDQRLLSKASPQKFIKAVYREYTDATYSVPKPRPPWAGIQGPVIVTQPRERVVIHFKNLATQPYSISPVGITYWKQSEGAGYDDSTAGKEKEDDAVFPGKYHKYVWDISAADGPTIDDPECLTYSYSSQVDPVRDLNSGLIGALIICQSSAFSKDNERRNIAFVLLFAVFDESKSWYREVGERRSRDNIQKNNRKEYHTINGYINSTLPGLTMCQKRVFWHMIGVGTAPEIHSIHFQGHTLKVMKHRKVTMEVTPMTFVTAEMKPGDPGRFLISCQIHAHRLNGMRAMFKVENCPVPDVRNAKQDDYDEYEDDNYNTINLQPMKPRSHGGPGRKQRSKIWKHYIAAEEVIWDYAPHHTATDSELESRLMPEVPRYHDYKYKKVAYVEYADRSFTRRKNTVRTLMGPFLKGKVNDRFHITFKNLASHPFNIYPNDLTKVYPLLTSTNVAENDLRSMEVPPNGTFVYVWELTTEDGPLEEDPECLSQLYQSTVSPERDLASGLVGTLLICKSKAFDARRRLLAPDKEWTVIFAVFDENKSWYVDENIYQYQNSSRDTNPDLYNSNVIYSINGIIFSRHHFLTCKTDVTFWHVANVGTQSDFLSVYFTGNLFQHNGLYQSVLTLFPMTSMTIIMEMDLPGEWEISAFDGTLKSRGMSIHYSVCPCNYEETLVDRDEDIDDISDCVDALPKSRRPQNTTMIWVCKNITDSPNDTGGDNEWTVRGDQICQLQQVSSEGGNPISALEGGIPEEVLEELERNGKWIVDLNDTEDERSGRQRRQAEGNWTHEDLSAAEIGDDEIRWQSGGQTKENGTDFGVEMNPNQTSVMSLETNVTKEESNEILPDTNPNLKDNLLTESNLLDQLVRETHIENVSEELTVESLWVDYNSTSRKNTTGINLSLDYDDYNQEENNTSDVITSDKIDLRSTKTIYRDYYIAAEEITWDYGIRKDPHLIKPGEKRRGMRKFLPEYKKVVFKAYPDKNFLEPNNRGELHQHLGIMGPLIKVQINELLTVHFMNKASRPYSFHLQGVYDRTQGDGIAKSHDPLVPGGVSGDPVPPGESRTYSWRITKKQGPTDEEFDCKAGAYYSTVDKERDLHSGLIGPLLVCKTGTELPVKEDGVGPLVRDFSLLFHTFDETKSWYLEENLKTHCAPPCQVNLGDPWYQISNRFAAINGYVAETLPGLVVAQWQRVRWHLLNVGSDGEYHVVHFHGLPFTLHTEEEHRMGVYNLFPGVFGTMEMIPSTVGTWLVKCTVGDYQLAGMRAKLLVYDPECALPLGMKSGSIQDSQITASDHIDSWEPHLARLHQSGYINAWMGTDSLSWIQVDLLKPTLLHGIETQGVRASLRENFIPLFVVSYSLDQETWITYQGNYTKLSNKFHGNSDSSTVKQNQFSPPFVARYVRIHPDSFVRRPALRLELLGCDLNSCSYPLGLRSGLISNITASSYRSSVLRKWLPTLARLHQEGRTNAWRPKNNNPHEWLQVDLNSIKRITGVITQGARSFTTQMMVTEFSVTVSLDGFSWSRVLEKDSHREQIFTGNNDPDTEALTVFEPALFGRFMRIHPRGWVNDIALRLEVLGCITQQDL